MQILTLAKQMYPSETAWFIKEYEVAMRTLLGYRDLIPRFRKVFVFPTFFAQTETEFSNFSSSKNVLEKHSFRDGLLWVVEIKLR